VAAPLKEEYVPGLQLVHCEAPDDEYVPGEQLEQAVAPEEEEYVPALHDKHDHKYQ